MATLRLREPDLAGAPLSRHAADAIREAIQRGEVKPGDRLVEATIAAQLNLSRGPVRDALKQLQVEGLITIVPRRGSFVSKMDRSDVWEIASLRAVVEGLAARILAERRDEAAVKELEEILAEMASTGDTNPILFATLDLRFHEILCCRSGHERLIQCWSNLQTQIWKFIRETRIGQLRPAGSTIEIHEAMLDAIREGNASEAERLARFHSELSGRQLEDYLIG